MLHPTLTFVSSLICLTIIECTHLTAIHLKSSLPILPSKSLKVSKHSPHLAPLDQQVHQHLHQFQVAQQLSSPQPLVSSVATLLPSSMTPSMPSAVTSPLMPLTTPPSLRQPVTTVSPFLASALLATSTASSAATVSKASRAVQPVKAPNTYDWDVIYKMISRFTDLSNIGQGIKRSISGASSSSSSSTPSLSSIFYGLSMAAGLALGVTMSDSPMLMSFLNRVDHRFATRSSNRLYQDAQTAQQPPDFVHHITNPPMSSSSSSSSSKNNAMSSGSASNLFSSFDNLVTSETRVPSDPIIQRNIAPSKDGKDHYHHVVHYHIPYPMSVNALDAVKSSQSSTPWLSSDSANNRNDLTNHQTAHGNSGKMSVLSSYLNPFLGHNSANSMASNLKESLAARLSSLPFLGSNSGHSSSVGGVYNDYYGSSGAQKNPYESLNIKNTEASNSNERFNFNYPSPWQNRESNHTQYAQASTFSGGATNNNNYAMGSYDFANAFPGFTSELSENSDQGLRRNDQYRVFSDSEYFKSLNHNQSNGNSNASRKGTGKKSNSRKHRPKKPTMDELIFTGTSQLSASAPPPSNVNLVDQSSTSSPFSTASSSTLPDLLAVTES